MVCEGDGDLVVDHSAEKQGRRREDKAASCWLKSCCVYQVTGKKVKGDIYVEKEKRVKRSLGGCGGLRALSLLHCCQAEAAALPGLSSFFPQEACWGRTGYAGRTETQLENPCLASAK